MEICLNPVAIRAVFDWSLALWRHGDLCIAAELYAPACLVNGQPDSPDALKRDVQARFAAFPDMEFAVRGIEISCAEDREFVEHWTGRDWESLPELLGLSLGPGLEAP